MLPADRTSDDIIALYVVIYDDHFVSMHIPPVCAAFGLVVI